MSGTAAGKIRVLHVDDEPSFGDLTATFLEQESDRFDVETAVSADEGMAIIADDPPDCVVSDYNMPGRNGLEFLEAVRELYPDLPFILFTGRGSEQVASDAIAADVTDYLQKGPGSEQYELLVNRIRNAVQARRNAQRASRQQELMRLTEFAGDTGGWEVDLEAETTRLTDGSRRLVGLSEDSELSPEEAISMYHPEDRPETRQALDRAVETGEQVTGTWRLETVDGDERILDVTITPVEEGGEVTKLRGAIHDITERQQRKQELKAERRFIQQVLDTLEDLFYVIDRDGSLRRWNEQVSAVTGYSDTELAEMSGADLFPEGERETVADAIETTLAGETTTIQADVCTTDGGRIPYELRGAPLTDEDGETTGLVGIGRDLTEQRRHQRRFQALVEGSNDVISVIDDDGQLRYQSPSVEQVLGYTPGEMLGDIAWEYVHPEDREGVIERFGAWMADPDGTGGRVEYRARHADGSWRWMEARGSEQFDSPAVDGYLITSRDITARKERERRLRELKGQYQTLAESFPNGAVFLYDAEHRIVQTGGTELSVRGLSPGELEGSTPRDWFPADAARRLDRSLDQAFAGETRTIEMAYHGEQYRVRTTPVRTDDGEITHAMVVSETVTEQRDREQQLERERQRYATLFEMLPSPVLHARTESGAPVVQTVNEAFLETFGCDADAVVGDSLREHVLPEEQVSEGGLEQRVLPEEGLETEIRRETPDGVRTYQVNLGTRTTADGGREGYAVYTDITDRKQYERELEAQNERLDEFVGIVSHDLRNPLTVAQGRLELAREECSSDHLARAADAVDRGQALVEELLTLARDGREVRSAEPVDLAELARRSWETVETEAATLETDVSRRVRAEKSRLRQLFENLYRNAVEHGGDDVTVRVGGLTDGFYVADTGSGIPTANREEVFDAGYSTSADGTGFGLRIVEQAAEAHGWAVTVTESGSGGARFEFTSVDTGDC